MPTWPEISRSVYGAWRLALLDTGGMTYFDLSIGGFWRSFGAAFVTLPLYIYFVAVTFEGTEATMTAFVLVKALAYAVGWIAFPVVMIGLAPLLGLSARYIDFIVVTNWGSVLRSVVFVPINTLAGFGDAATGFGAMLYFVTMAAALAYQWYITRTSLQTNGITASGLVIVDLLLGFLVVILFRPPGLAAVAVGHQILDINTQRARNRDHGLQRTLSFAGFDIGDVGLGRAGTLGELNAREAAVFAPDSHGVLAVKNALGEREGNEFVLPGGHALDRPTGKRCVGFVLVDRFQALGAGRGGADPFPFVARDDHRVAFDDDGFRSGFRSARWHVKPHPK